MSFRRIDNNEILDIAQQGIAQGFARFLEIYQRDPSLIQKFKKGGFCVGFLVNAMYGKWLELTQKKGVEERDDWPWLESTLNSVAQWKNGKNNIKGNSQKKKKLRDDIDRVIGLVEYYQHIEEYHHISQIKIEKNLVDTSGNKFKKEFSFGGIFRAIDFQKRITIKKKENGKKIKVRTTLLNEIFKEDRLVFIVCHNHMTGGIKHNDHFYFYDSNETMGWVKFPESFALYFVDYILAGSGFNTNQRAGLGFYVLAHESLLKEQYPSHRKIISQLKINKTLYSADEHKRTNLFIAAEVGSLSAVAYYLKHPPHPAKNYINRKTTKGETALSVATEGSFIGIVRHLLMKGACVNIHCFKGNTPILEATGKENFKICFLLIKFKANLNIANNSGFTPLFLAAKQNQINLIKLFLHHGARPNKKTLQGDYPLHESVRNGNFKATELLLRYGAEPCVYNKKKKSPFLIALQKGFFEIAKLLMQQNGFAINRKEYKLISNLRDQLPENEMLNAIHRKARVLIIINEIKVQLKRVKSNKAYQFFALKELKRVRRLVRNFTDDQAALTLLDKMRPFLKKQTSLPFSLWKRLDLEGPVLQLAKEIGLLEKPIQNPRQQKRHSLCLVQ